MLLFVVCCLFVLFLFTSSSSTLRGLVKNLDGNEIKKYYPKYILQTYYRTAIVKENVWNELWWLIWMDVFPYPIFCHSFEDIWVPTYIGIQKISCIGPWVSRIYWCKGHLFDSTNMVMKLSDISSKTGKKCVFCVFRLFLSLCWTASLLYKLRQTNALRINQFY